MDFFKIQKVDRPIFCVLLFLVSILALNAVLLLHGQLPSLPQVEAHQDGDALWGISSDGWVAIFTFVLAISTIGLWFATWLTFQHSKESSERQLRAYVFVTETRIKTKKSEVNNVPKFLIRYQYQNLGETPASNITVSLRAKLTPTNTKIDLNDLPQPEPVGPLGPQSKLYDDVPIEGLRAEEDLKALLGNVVKSAIDAASSDDLKIETGTHEIHFYGRIEYEDAFKEKRWTTFYSCGGGNIPFSKDLDTQKEGNDYC